MKASKLRPADYEELFRIDVPVSYYVSQLFMYQYKKLDCLLIYCNGTWQTFLPKKVFQRLLVEGKRFYCDRTAFLNWKMAFDTYMSECQKFLEKYKTMPTTITKQVFEEITETVQLFWTFYYKTEFFYSNQAYEDAKKPDAPSDLKKNLEELEDIKTRGRLLLNEFTLSVTSILMRIMHALSQQYNIPFDLIGGLSYDELIELIEKDSVKMDKAKQRQECFAIAGDKDQLAEFTYEQSKKICQSFTKASQTDILKGTIAYKGKVQGKVIIVPSQLFTKEFIQERLNKMNEHNILVAHTTSPDLILLCKKATAIITDQGGLGSHAAIVSREFKIPCIVGTKNATKIFKDGDLVEVDANVGIVIKLK
jgi:phosphohistidine swiveling domain-containing protein